MHLTIQSIHFDADHRLLAFVQRKCSKLDQFFDAIVDAQVYLRLEKNKEVGNKVVEIKVLVPNNILLATERAASFEEATDKASESLRRQIQKYKARVRETV
jgi:putative sigma-54 modulation protein